MIECPPIGKYSRIFFSSITLFFTACEPEIQVAYRWRIKVLDQDSRPVAGARLQVKLPGDAKHRVHDLGDTPGDGCLTFAVNLKLEGTAALHAACPKGYLSPDASPEQLISVVFRQSQRLLEDRSYGNTSVPIATSVVCKKSQHRLALLVKAPSAIGVPLKVDGLSAAKIDANGFAEISVSGPQGMVKTVSFDTRDFPKLRPQNPLKTLKMSDRDAVEIWNQTFEIARPSKRSRRPVKIRRLPMRIE